MNCLCLCSCDVHLPHFHSSVSVFFVKLHLSKRYGADTFLSTGHYSPSETHGTRSTNAMDAPPTHHSTAAHHYTRSTTHERANNVIHTSTWVSSAHAKRGNDVLEWSGARRGDYGVIAQRAVPTASQWLEQVGWSEEVLRLKR